MPKKVMGKTVTLITVLVILCCSASYSQDNQDRYFTSVLDSSLQAAKGGDYTVIDALYASASHSDNPMELYVDLLDYYLGAGAGERAC